jgi:hypothetical protein
MNRERKVVPGAVPRLIRNALRRRRRAFVSAGLFVLLLVLLGGCGRSQSAQIETKDDYQVSLATEPAAPEQGAGMVIVTLKDKQGNPVDGVRISVEANMSHAGMKPEYADATTGANGVYRLPLKWTMGGAWYVDVKITLRSGDVLRRRFPVDVK